MHSPNPRIEKEFYRLPARQAVPASGTGSAALTVWTASLFLASALFAHDVALRLLLLFGGAACAVAYMLKARGSVRVLPPIWLPFVLWAAWATLSLTWSLDPARTLKELHNEVGYTALALLLGYVAGQARDSLRIAVPVLAGAAALLCAVAIHHYFVSPDPYAEGWEGGPGHLSSSLLMLLPGVIGAAWLGRRYGWPAMRLQLAAALGILILCAGYISQNRTIWVGVALQLTLMLALLQRRGSRPWSRRKLAVVAAAILVSSLVIVAFIQGEREEAAKARPLETDPRIVLWSEAMHYIDEKPLTGYGFGRGLLRAQLRDETGDPMLWHSHNLFLDAALQTGLPGLALFALLLAATVWQAWKLARDPDDRAAAAGVVLLALICGMLVRNMTDLLFLRHNALFYWGAVGLLLGWGRQLGSSSASR